MLRPHLYTPAPCTRCELSLGLFRMYPNIMPVMPVYAFGKQQHNDTITSPVTTRQRDAIYSSKSGWRVSQHTKFVRGRTGQKHQKSKRAFWRLLVKWSGYRSWPGADARSWKTQSLTCQDQSAGR